MTFNYVDRSTWDREEYFTHYFDMDCSFSMTADVEMTGLFEYARKNDVKPTAIIYYFTMNLVNKYKEFRYTLDENGNLGYWDTVHLSYIINHKDDTMSNIWTEYDEDFSVFYENYLNDLRTHGNTKGLFAKKNMPANHVKITNISGTKFTGFDIKMNTKTPYLAPMFTLGRIYREEGKDFLPMSVQVHHAVCDGHHVSRFFNKWAEMAMICDQYL